MIAKGGTRGWFIWIEISLVFVPNSPIGNTLALVQVIAWHRAGDKSLYDPMRVLFIKSSMHHLASMSYPFLSLQNIWANHLSLRSTEKAGEVKVKSDWVQNMRSMLRSRRSRYDDVEGDVQGDMGTSSAQRLLSSGEERDGKGSRYLSLGDDSLINHTWNMLHMEGLE